MTQYQAFDIQGLDGVLRKLQELPKEVTQHRGGPVRTSLRKAAHVIRKQAQANIRHITTTPNIGGVERTTGLMEKSVRVVRGRPHKTLNGERMFVLIPKRIRYPIDQRTPTGIPVAMVGRLLEYGYSTPRGDDGSPHSRRPIPWMAPAFHAKKAEAVRTVVTELHKGIDRIVKKLSRQP